MQLGNLCNVRGALEEGRTCFPTHWLCLENLIVVYFKLCAMLDEIMVIKLNGGLGTSIGCR